ncbi:MAG: glycosyltransferase family 2 protein [Myxococcota bacterium]
MQPSRTLTVVVPTYGRPHQVAPMLAALAVQTRPPDEVLYVVRQSDGDTNAALDRARSVLPLRRAFVTIPGHVPPIEVGTHAARSDVIAVIDDDARPASDWCERILEHFGRDPRLGILAGRVREEGRSAPPTHAARSGKVGQVQWPGRLPGEFVAMELEGPPIDVMAAGGGNMAYRREALANLDFDLRLNLGSSRFYENDLCWQARNAGWRVCFAADVVVDHRSDTAARGDGRPGETTHAFTVGHNWTLIVLKNAPPATRAAFVPYWFLWGASTSPGPLRYAAALAFGRPTRIQDVLEGWRGRVEGVRKTLRSR